MSKKLATVVIDVGDVRRAGGVVAAIEKRANESSELAAGVVGMAFATSGPGPGWSRQYGEDEWSREAFNGGALAYIDAADGKVRRAEAPDEDDDEDNSDEEDTVLTDIGGCRYRVGDWSSESEVYVECPSEEDALEYPELVAEMAQAVIDYHHPLSNRKAWKELIDKIQDAGHYFSYIDPDKLAD